MAERVGLTRAILALKPAALGPPRPLLFPLLVVGVTHHGCAVRASRRPSQLPVPHPHLSSLFSPHVNRCSDPP
jgi:hypothetical protein